MLTAEATGLVLSLALGLVKLGARIDLLMAVQGALAQPMPKVAAGPALFSKIKRLRGFVAQSAGAVPDPPPRRAPHPTSGESPSHTVRGTRKS